MSTDTVRVRVSAIAPVSETIREFQLGPVDAPLFPFSPGSHVVVEMPDTPRPHRNAYSLLGDPLETGSYRIAVRRQEQSRGGSIYMHERVQVGDELRITPPANLFAPAWQARKHLLIAGGVGITPFLAYIHAFERSGAEFELHYLFRHARNAAYRDELSARLGARCHLYDAEAGTRCDLRALLAGHPPGTHAYVCGPEALIAGVREVAAELGWPASHVHFEAFAAPAPGESFKVALARSGRELQVDGDTTLLEALEAADVQVASLCRAGICGQCQTRVVEGAVEHRDDFLSAAEKAQGDCIMPCVSRAAGHRLVLDL